MPHMIQTGLHKLTEDSNLLLNLGKNVGYLGHEASVTSRLEPGHLVLNKLIGKRLNRLFGPQHGFATLDQDNMIETKHQVHPSLGIPVYSLYSNTRKPTPEMLDGLDTLIIDLQDVGTRVYTYIWTLYLIMESCKGKDIRILVLDRPNPIDGKTIEGNLPESEWYSFVCMGKIPMRHGLTIGEMALLFNKEFDNKVNLELIPMTGWKRSMHWDDTGLIWVNPSPNLPTYSGSLVFPGTVLIEGTTLSEGRGTTRSLELFGHPELDPYKLGPIINKELRKSGQSGFALRPTFFKPTFQKHMDKVCGGFQVHCTNRNKFEPWKLMQHILRILYHEQNLEKFWHTNPYEYETKGLGIDFINGSTSIRNWIESNGSSKELIELEINGQTEFEEKRKEILIY
jgi:uncharacterized protein YbbC (DUF1343 family)